MREHVPRGELCAGLERRVDDPVEGEQAEDDRQDDADPEQRAVASGALARSTGRHAESDASPPGASLCRDCTHCSSASARRFPPASRMYSRDTAITMTNVRTASADPWPIKRFCVSCWYA